METFLYSLLFFLVFSSASSETLIQILPENPNSSHPSGQEETKLAGNGVYCDSWHLSVETNNAGVWEHAPATCTEWVKEYMEGTQYLSDSMMTAKHSLSFANTVPICRSGKEAWVFDIDETLLSNAAHFIDNGFGSRVRNEASFNGWVDSATAPALPASLWLYKKLLELGFELVLLTGRSEEQRKATVENLSSVGYHSWNRLILRQASDVDKTAEVYKSEKRAELIAEGYTIYGNSGDQWSDLLGSATAKRSFKLPNPMYYLS